MTDSNKRESLADAFARPNKSGKPQRSEGLASLLTTRTTGTAEKPAPSTRAVAFDTPVEAAGASPDQKQRPRASQRAKPASANSAGGVVNTATYLPPALLEKIRAYKRARELTYAEILVEAFDEVSDTDLSDTFAVRPRNSKSGMPLALPIPRGEEGVQINLRLTTAQIEWLREKEGVVGAPSRSALVAKAFERFFDGRTN